MKSHNEGKNHDDCKLIYRPKRILVYMMMLDKEKEVSC
jgi:ribosomal protein L36